MPLNKIKILQIGPSDLSLNLQIPSSVEWIYLDKIEDLKLKEIDLFFMDRNIRESEYKYFFELVKAYRVFVFEDLEVDSCTKTFMKSKMANSLKKSQLQTFINEDSSFFFSYSYGEQYEPKALQISQSFKGEIIWNGSQGAQLKGDYGEFFHQIAYWKCNLPIHTMQGIDLWLEYEKDDFVSIELRVDLIVSGSLSDLVDTFIFTEDDLSSPVFIQNTHKNCEFFVSLYAKGEGSLRIKALHDRHSRKNYGTFLPGGIRRVTKNREESFFYFDPMDMKPPLCVYFSGYKTQEGFEGYNMMRRFHTPFLLISESRLEGGAFYIGDDEYEQVIKDEIQDCLDFLHFSSSDLVFSGLSMGTYGALYYGCFFKPYALILGKPLTSIGSIASNERLNRPGGFPTSLDVILKFCGDLSEDSIQKMNERYWALFDQSDWSDTRFIISYMIEDDYDSNAYQKLIQHIDSNHITLFGKGLHGRHNDNTYGIVSWFIQQYQLLLENDFERKFGDDDA